MRDWSKRRSLVDAMVQDVMAENEGNAGFNAAWV